MKKKNKSRDLEYWTSSKWGRRSRTAARILK